MTNTTEAARLNQIALAAAEEALAESPVALDVSGSLYFADIFLILTADNPRHSKGIVDAISRAIKAQTGQLPRAVEGDKADGAWVVLDYGDLIVHVMLEEERGYYALEKLWDASPRLN